ncbi:baseplate J/gp47 family protein [Marinicrinis lubricantis]|uniref:Baseplate J/gp47 family protein n=1 Tax=Marinicrinis lubricantis TaxID=2086470 RepID=A0ABW1IHC2_9BACL
MVDQNEILKQMLDAVPNDQDKRAGSFMYDALAPAAEQFAKANDAIASVKEKLSIEELTGEELAQRVRERTGILRREATNAIGSVTLTGTGTIYEGDRFETSNGTQFRAAETKEINSSGDVAIEAVQAGSIGMVAADTITLFPVTLAGFTAVTNHEPTRDGFEAESDTDLLQRYYDRIRTPATSGNKAHYLNWAKEVGGVGNARVFPLWNGDNTVKVVIINSDRLPASEELVEVVQDYIDPNAEGLGNGTAPIGAHATVASASGVEIDVSVTVSLSVGYNKQQVMERISANLRQYLKEVAFVEDRISVAKVGAAILNSEGVEDYSELLLNGDTSNVRIGEEEVAVLGMVNVNVVSG